MIGTHYKIHGELYRITATVHDGAGWLQEVSAWRLTGSLSEPTHWAIDPWCNELIRVTLH